VIQVADEIGATVLLLLFRFELLIAVLK